MAAALVTLLILSWVGLAAATGSGYAVDPGWMAATRHVSTALPAALLGTLAHALTPFYFIGTGRAVRVAVAEAGLGAEWNDEAAALRSRCRTPAYSAIGLIMTVTILGGGADTGAVPDSVHGLLGVAALGVAGWASVVETVAISRMMGLLFRLDEAVAQAEAAVRTVAGAPGEAASGGAA